MALMTTKTKEIFDSVLHHAKEKSGGDLFPVQTLIRTTQCQYGRHFLGLDKDIRLLLSL